MAVAAGVAAEFGLRIQDLSLELSQCSVGSLQPPLPSPQPHSQIRRRSAIPRSIGQACRCGVCTPRESAVRTDFGFHDCLHVYDCFRGGAVPTVSAQGVRRADAPRMSAQCTLSRRTFDIRTHSLFLHCTLRCRMACSAYPANIPYLHTLSHLL